jgi:tetraacyldisaccharide 4'-kinase
VLTRCDQVSAEQREAIHRKVARLAPHVGVIETVHRPVEWVNSDGQTAPLEMANRRPTAAFCGIGNPEAFRQTLEMLGAKPAAFRIYPDHHAYTRSDVHDLQAWAREQAGDALIATTQKDLVKLRLSALGSRPLWALRIGLHVESGEETLHRELDRVATAVPCC